VTLELGEHLAQAIEQHAAGHADAKNQADHRQSFIGLALLLAARVGADFANLPPGDAAATAGAGRPSGGPAGTNRGELQKDHRCDQE
jgi:hypothetical protein